ncbi:FAD-dependent oxidoreductase [Rhodobacteraceae bacterium N5(2021)]|uniref:FAD-dependent oxidoreductase n=1 Tax=Gymnodinialimonas phycosphaerae TaxID=2841589 RepID=A0A975TUT1_9RHOB|nr:FAD-dependent oxidoreductase [Gymnodinialimonas phycosphaerae]MBY4891296.1 FAD-dependent oxidoreductase [Gymnodinialimonas phycosphaerae]
MVGATYALAHKLYPYAPVPDQRRTAHHPVIIIGGGPIGVATGLDLAQKGTPALILDDHDGVGQGSRAICFAKRTLEIADRLGAGAPMRDKGVVWNVGRVFHGAHEIYDFNLLPEDGHRNPAFINLQQPYFEKFLVDALRNAQSKSQPIEIRGRNQVLKLEQDADRVTLTIDTPDGPYTATADYVIACDGARSPTRDMMGLDFKGRVFEDNFLIADVKMTAPFPTERWFWFEPPLSNAPQSALLHKQPDDVWRIDFQLGWDIDRAAELSEEKIRNRIDEFLPAGTQYDLVWTSIYTFQCRRMERFRHGRVIFAGDAAHQVSPFGARGANSGMQDADNLAWKLDLVLKGQAPEALLDSYHEERAYGADENILNSTRATDFLTPKTEMSKIFRNAVLTLAKDHAFARPMVNSGRLSVPCTYDGLSLNTPDALPHGPACTRPGSPCPDAPLHTAGSLGETHLLDLLNAGFTLLALNTDAPNTGLRIDGISLNTIRLSGPAITPEIRDRYLGDAPHALYLIRPDQHVAARWDTATPAQITSALKTATAQT